MPFKNYKIGFDWKTVSQYSEINNKKIKVSTALFYYLHCSQGLWLVVIKELGRTCADTTRRRRKVAPAVFYYCTSCCQGRLVTSRSPADIMWHGLGAHCLIISWLSYCYPTVTKHGIPHYKSRLIIVLSFTCDFKFNYCK